MQKELITLYKRILVAVDEGGVVPGHLVTAFNTEIAIFGYSFDKDCLMHLGRLSPLGFATLRADLLKELGVISGSGAYHAVLFNNFPYETPDQYDYLLRRIYGWLQDCFDIRRDHARILSCGHVIDPALFDISAFGACPICQRQVDELDSPDVPVTAHQRITPLKVLSHADETFLTTQAQALLSRNSSLNADEKTFLAAILRRSDANVVVPDTMFRESLPFVYDAYVHRQPHDKADLGTVRRHLSSATDVLRIAAFLSDNMADLSLKEPVKFKLSTRDKKYLLCLLESLDGIEEDMLRHRERWLRLGEQLHPTTRKNRAKYPKTAAAFDLLRNRPKRIATFNRVVEAKIRAHQIDPVLMATLWSRPGELLRRLDLLLRRADDPDFVLSALPMVTVKTPTKLLLDLRKYLLARKTAAGTRVFVPKGASTKVTVLEDRRPPIASDVLDRAVRNIDTQLALRFQKLPSWGKVYIDPRLKEIVLPFNRRGDSSTNVAVPKGSRVPLDAEDVVRLFVHWTGSIDVDLSLAVFDQNWSRLQVISFYNLRGWNCIHSGDIQRAPNGASEFIDFEISDLLAHGARYAVATVIIYSGKTFDTFPCFAGFMARDGLRSGKRYEPSEVALKFDIDAKTKSHLPLIFDLAERKVVFADIASGQSPYSTADRENTKMVALTQAVLALPDTKPTVHDVLSLHAKARATLLVNNPMNADTAFTLDRLDLEAVLTLTA